MKMIIGLVGETGSGKGTLIQIFKEIVQPHTVFHASTVGILRETFDLWRITPTKRNLQILAIRMDESFGLGTLTRALKHRIDASDATFIIYDCIRWQSDLRLIRSYPQHLIVYVTTKDPKTRWERTRLRGEKEDEKNATFEQFCAAEKR